MALVTIDIHDVDHGGCAVVTGPLGHRLMLDCGLNLEKPWYPSVAYRGQRIDTLMLMNLDEDHVEDLRYVWQACPLGAIVSNPTVSAPILQAMKAEGGMRDGVKSAVSILDTFGGGFIGSWGHDLGGVRWHAFWNRYGWDFTDTNNLSLAVFVSFGRFTILFGGDMETPGWKALLRWPAFRARLADVTVFVASHHGRENGKCEELFALCRPQLVVMSDGPKQYTTQECGGWYAERVTGIPDYGAPTNALIGPRTRRLMTTRKDGTIQFRVSPSGDYLVGGEPPVSALAHALASYPLPAQTGALSYYGVG